MKLKRGNLLDNSKVALMFQPIKQKLKDLWEYICWIPKDWHGPH